MLTLTLFFTMTTTLKHLFFIFEGKNYSNYRSGLSKTVVCSFKVCPSSFLSLLSSLSLSPFLPSPPPSLTPVPGQFLWRGETAGRCGVSSSEAGSPGGSNLSSWWNHHRHQQHRTEGTIPINLSVIKYCTFYFSTFYSTAADDCWLLVTESD